MSRFLSTILLAIAASLPAYAELKAGQTIYVEVNKTKVRTEPEHWAPSTVELSYGAPVKVTALSPGWLEVTTSEGKRGYVPESAVTFKKILFRNNSGPVKVEADESDIVLAGKGFNSDVESALSATDAELNFKAVDEISDRQVKDSKLARFVQEGRLGRFVKNS